MEFSLGILIGLVGLALLVWAFVRPRRGDEPHCRRCGFSLVGLTEPKNCPECGRELARRRSTVIGSRPSAKRAFVLSAVLLFASGVLVGLDWMNRTGFFPLTEHKPAFILQAEAYLLGDLRASMATDELVARIGKGELGTKAEDRLVATALTRHAQTWRAFPDAQWIVITRAMGQNKLSAEQIKRVWENLFNYVEAHLANEEREAFYPGETVEILLDIDYRAGKLIVNNTWEMGFVSVVDINPKVVGEGGMRLDLPITPNTYLSIAQKAVVPINGDWFDRHSLLVTLPESIGEHDVRLEIHTDLLASFVVGKWQYSDTKIIEELSTLKNFTEIPLTFRVAEVPGIDRPIVDPAEFAENPADLIAFTVEEAMAVGPTGRDPGLIYLIGTADRLDERIGLGGCVVFMQGDHLSMRVPIEYEGPHKQSRKFVPLRSFTPGLVEVWYEYDQNEARHVREHMSRTLGGPIFLGTIEIPGPDAQEPE